MRFDPAEVLGHICYRIRNCIPAAWPFPHFYIENAFPTAFYLQLINNLPSLEGYREGAGKYNGRKFADQALIAELDFLKSEEMIRSVVHAFMPSFQRRFPDGKFTPQQDIRLILDSENYAIGPHTDAPWKIVSLLFYLPPDTSMEQHGTSIYLPNDPNFRCPGGPHHKFDNFTKIVTAPFRPNTLFGFFKTDQSFHGVEPIMQPCRRDVLLWNLYDASLRN